METGKSTGMIRRIDDLGRMVIPKEIRRRLRVREGDPMEIFATDDSVTFQKYSPVGRMSGCAELLKGLYEVTRCPALLCDRDSVAAACGVPKDKYEYKPFSEAFTALTDRRRPFHQKDGAPVPVLEDSELYVDILRAIRVCGEAEGWLVLLKTDHKNAAAVPPETKQICAELLAETMKAMLEAE
jgi:AbrB family transcriptional regulator (stage V sporulation protein T)